MSARFNSEIAVIGIDIGKNLFHIVGLDRRGAIVLRQKWSRGQIEARLSRPDRHDDLDWPRRIGLGRSDPRDGRQRDGARGQMQKLPSMGKFLHFEPPITSFNYLVGA